MTVDKYKFNNFLKRIRFNKDPFWVNLVLVTSIVLIFCLFIFIIIQLY